MMEIQDGATPTDGRIVKATVYDHTPLDCVIPRQECHWSRFLQEAWSNIPDNMSRLRRIVNKATNFQWWHRAKAKVRNASKTNDPLLDISLKAQLSMYLCAFTYCLA
ncbi:hypothetical protein ACMFMG_007444 [Clarireedia jacksonii]